MMTDRDTGNRPGYGGDSPGIPASCGGDCSDHRILIGTVAAYTS